MADLSMTISGEALDILDRLASAKNKTVNEVLGDAVALEQFVAEVKVGGGRLFVMDQNGKLREVALP
jgi:DNA-binding ferritin-like protein (Dps family)